MSIDEHRKISTTIRERMAENHLTYVWLISKLADIGLVTSKSEMSSVLAGTRQGKKACDILFRSIDVLDAYESAMNGH